MGRFVGVTRSYTFGGCGRIMHKNAVFRQEAEFWVKLKKKMTDDPDLVGTDWVKLDPRPKGTPPLVCYILAPKQLDQIV